MDQIPPTLKSEEESSQNQTISIALYAIRLVEIEVIR